MEGHRHFAYGKRGAGSPCALAASKRVFSTHTIPRADSMTDGLRTEGPMSGKRDQNKAGAILILQCGLALFCLAAIEGGQRLGIGKPMALNARRRAGKFDVSLQAQLPGVIFCTLAECRLLSLALSPALGCFAASGRPITQNYLRVSPGIATVDR